MDDDIKRVDTNMLRIKLSKFLKENKGDTIFITRYNELVGELRIYTDEIKMVTQLRLARKMVEDARSSVK
ncbi:MAG: hypothetical protein MUO59_06770 [Actinobacteria bacterium]|nr:hypothetical protein [Actinomycetota bacterium]